MKKKYVIIMITMLLLFASCAAPLDSLPPDPASTNDLSTVEATDPVSDTTESVPESEEAETEPQTFAPEDQITNFPVFSEAEKEIDRQLRQNDPRNPQPIVEWKRKAKTCPYTAEEIVSLISPGDRLEDVYERIGYPTYRDDPNNPPNNGLDLRFMSYETADHSIVWVQPVLAGYYESDYHYIIYSVIIPASQLPSVKSERYVMTFDELVRAEALTVYSAVEEKGVDYLLENDLITPYEATLYAAEEAIYQASVAAMESPAQATE